MKSVSDKSYRQTRKTHILSSIFFSEKRAVYEIMWKTFCKGGGQATDDNMAHARYILDTEG
jgi:hypothetical protein